MDTKAFNLATAIWTYVPFNLDEARHLEKVKKFITEHDNLFERSNLAGHITGSAFLFNRDHSKVLLTHHKKLQDWFQFGGHSDGDANTLRVAARETTEESGITDFAPLTPTIFDLDVHQIPDNPKKNEPAHYHYDLRFAFVTPTEKFVVSEESDTLQWFTLAEFKKLPATPARTRFIQKWERLHHGQK